MTDINTIAYTNAAAGLNSSNANVHDFALSYDPLPSDIPEAYASIGITAVKITNMPSRIKANSTCSSEASIDSSDTTSTIPPTAVSSTPPVQAEAIFHPSGMSFPPDKNTRMPSVACCLAPSRIQVDNPSVNRVARITPGTHTAEASTIRPSIRTKSVAESSASDQRDSVNRTPTASTENTPNRPCSHMV
ncbi:hypothetical protein CXF43_09645 [Corynebacterium bovis]|nr:hypothetical protein CXF43_09645 [Corynebacterium bovis]RRQ09165.1 hypothetical protein CXF44_08975 [Corynebacterium bovis]